MAQALSQYYQRAKTNPLKRAPLMIYNLTQLTSLSDIDKMLSIAIREKNDQQARKISLLQRLERTTTLANAMAQDMADVDADIAQVTAQIPLLSEGSPEKVRKQIELSRFETKKLQLVETGMSPSYTEIMKQERLHDLAVIDLVLPEKLAYITALEARKTEIQNA